ncbi:hypothetical protein ABPG72_018743 [Tetrahymena utriculariae]
MSSQDKNHNQMRSSFKSQSRSKVQYIKKEALQDDKAPKQEEVKIQQAKTNEASTSIQKESQPISHSNNLEQVTQPSDKQFAEQSNHLDQDNSSSQQKQSRPERDNNQNQQQHKQRQRNNRNFKTTYIPKKLLQNEVDSSQTGQESNNADSQAQSNKGQSNNLNENQQNSNNLQMNGRQSYQGNGTNTQKYKYNYRNGSAQPKNDRYSQGSSSQLQNQTKSSLFYQLKPDQENTTNEGNQFEDSPQKNQRNFQSDNLRKSEKEQKTSQKKDYAQIQTMLKRQNDNMIARNSRKNHSIVKTPDAHLLVSCNWDGIENVEQSYELLQKKSIGQDVSSFCQQENSTSQAFPSLLDDSSRLSKFAQSFLRPSRKASISSSETNPQELTHQIHQIVQELQQKQDQQVEKPVHDTQAIQVEKQEAIMESEEFNYKEEEKTKQTKKANATSSSKENKQNNQKQSNKNQRDSVNKGRKSNTIIYVRKDNVQKEPTPKNQITQKKSVVYEEKLEVVQQKQQQYQEKEYPDILNDIEFEMDLDINPTQTKKNQNNNQRQERDLQNANFNDQLIVEQQQEDHQSEHNKKDSSNFQEHNESEVYPRISNLDEYVPVQFTAEQQEAFEKGEYQELQKEIDQFQKQGQQLQNECREENQRDISTDVILQQKEEEDFVQIEEDEGLASKLSCQSPPPTENLTQQDVDAALAKFEEENQNEHHLSKFGQKYEKDLEEKVIEQLQKKHIFEQNAEPSIEDSNTLTTSEKNTDNLNSKQVVEKINEDQDNKSVNSQQKESVEQQQIDNQVIQNNALPVVNDQIECTANTVIEENEIQEAFNHFQQRHKSLASQNEEENVEITSEKQKSEEKEEDIQQQLEKEVEEVEIFVTNTQQSIGNYTQSKQERDLQSHNGHQLEDQFKQDEQTGHQTYISLRKDEKQVKEQKTIDELDKQCEYFNANSNYSSDKQNNTQTQDDISSAKHIEVNGFLLEGQSERNFDDSNHDLNSEYLKTESPTRRKTRFLQQFSDNLKDMGKNNTFLVNSLGSNIVTTFAGYVCNKIVTSCLLKNGKLNHSSGNRSLFSSFTSLNSSIKN